jgi:vancomycin resistance protein YoaR
MATRTDEMRVHGRARARARVRMQRRLAATVAVLAVVAIVVGGHVLLQRGHVVDGVSAAGVQLGGKDRASAQAALGARVNPLLRRSITVRAGGETAQVIPAKLGIRLDARATVSRALALGRLQGALFSIGYHRQVEPVLRYPKHFHVPIALYRATKQPVDARLTLRSNGFSKVYPSKPGVGFADAATLAAIGHAALAGRTTVTLKTAPVEPRITTAAASRAARRVHRMLSAPVLIQHGSQPSGELVASQLAPLLVARPYGHQIGVSFDPAKVRDSLLPLLDNLLRDPRDASWRSSGAAAQVVSSLTGVALDEKATARHLTAAALVPKGQRRVARLGLMVVHPHFTTKQARAMHITSTIAAFTTDMGVSSSNRIHNVHLMADILQDRVIAPGTSFSFNQVVGPRTAERGFLEGQAIENGLLVPSIGGGVCQVATTIYNAAFKAGLPIVTRTNHSFYISHYPLGMDATVADGGPDFVFTNDTIHPIVIKTSYTDQTLTVSLLSAPLGRRVETSTSDPTRYTDPKTRYIHDDTVADGTIVQQTTGERGFDVSVSRTVYASNGIVLSTQSFPSHYSPEDVVYGMGNGALPPGSKPDKTKTGTSGSGTGTTGTGTTGTDTTGTGTGSTDTTSTDTAPTSTGPTGN